MHKLSIKRLLWLSLGCICVALGAIGMFLPLLPTTSFLLVAAFSFARSSPRFYSRLTDHRLFGPLISNWQLHRAISSKAKALSVMSMIAVVVISILCQVSTMMLLVQIFVLACIAIFLISRPVPPSP